MTSRLPLGDDEATLLPPITKHGAAIYVGTSGFKFDDWKGHFYPETVKEKDWLRYYAARFNCLEINASYYRLLPAVTYERMMQVVPPGFQFTVKAYRSLTHEAGSENERDFAVFLASLQPLLGSGEFGCVLAQFPTSFHNTPENRSYLAAFRDWFAEIPLVVEFRGREWLEGAVFDYLREREIGFCAVDEPQFKSLLPPVAVATSPIGYVRFHGRNYQKWWKGGEGGKERYDYLYKQEELEEWVPKITQVAAETQRVYVFMNNCYQGQAATNAVEVRELLDL
jgi:uncharacterized protein YecE (DUF72 family)